jgi:hypothetical protein
MITGEVRAPQPAQGGIMQNTSNIGVAWGKFGLVWI